jgi:YesN/AraC family two-component response regulator
MTRILIADDHDVVRSGLNAILSSQSGWEVVAEAEDGRKAVELVAETRPFSIISFPSSTVSMRHAKSA